MKMKKKRFIRQKPNVKTILLGFCNILEGIIDIVSIGMIHKAYSIDFLFWWGTRDLKKKNTKSKQ